MIMNYALSNLDLTLYQYRGIEESFCIESLHFAMKYHTENHDIILPEQDGEQMVELSVCIAMVPISL